MQPTKQKQIEEEDIETYIEDEEIDTPKEYTEQEEERKSSEEKVIRNRYYAKFFRVKDIDAVLTQWKANIVFHTVELGDITYKLKKVIETKTFSAFLGMNITETKTEKVTMQNINETIPEIVKQMKKLLLKNKKPLDCQGTFSENIVTRDGLTNTYRFFYDGDISTLYVKEIDGNDISKVDRQRENEQKRKQKVDINLNK